MVVFLGVFLGLIFDGLIRRSLRCIAIISKNYIISTFGYIRLYRALFFYLFSIRDFFVKDRFFACVWYVGVVSLVCLINYYLNVDIFLQLILLLNFYFLLLIAWLDYKTKMIPDFLSYAVFWLGVFALSVKDSCQLMDHLYVAVFAYVALKLLQQIYLLGFRKDALGDADPLLAFCIGVWLDFWHVPYFFMLAVFATLVPVVVSTRLKAPVRTMEIPFGPGLAFAGFVFIEFKFIAGSFIVS